MVRLGDVTIKLNQRGINATINSSRSPVYRMIRNDTQQAYRVARRTVHRRSGELRSSIEREVTVVPNARVTGHVYTRASYGLYVEVGTATPIRPRRGPYLIFRSTRRRDRGRLYVLREVRGQPGQRYLTLGLLEAVRGKDYDVDVRLGAPFSGLSRIP